jgi:hypothetical protein
MQLENRALNGEEIIEYSDISIPVHPRQRKTHKLRFEDYTKPMHWMPNLVKIILYKKECCI